ncbi:unnamed protein product, partial [Didymodactylos carnosus]
MRNAALATPFELRRACRSSTLPGPGGVPRCDRWPPWRARPGRAPAGAPRGPAPAATPRHARARRRGAPRAPAVPGAWPRPPPARLPAACGRR